MESVIYDNWYEYYFAPFICVLGICMIARWSGVEVDFLKKRSGKEILQNVIVWIMILFCGMVFMWLLMLQHELWLLHQLGIDNNLNFDYYVTKEISEIYKGWSGMD